MEKQAFIVITGPTAAGKTALSIALAKEIGGEIISADSMQIYKGMDIGTAKPSQEEMAGIAHHMIDVVSPKENYSVATYVKQSKAAIEEILARGKQPIIVGGTGLYIDALFAGDDFAKAPSDEMLRESLAEEYDKLGGQVMWERLKEYDPQAANTFHPNDKRRIIRGLEVIKLTGDSLSAYHAKTKEQTSPYTKLHIAVSAKEREDLYKRIDMRVDFMLKNGLVEEVASLMTQGLEGTNTAMQGIGYKEIVAVLLGEMTMEVAVEKVKQESRRYAKRQLSWLRRNKEIKWLHWEREPNKQQLLKETLDLWDDFSKKYC